MLPYPTRVPAAGNCFQTHACSPDAPVESGRSPVARMLDSAAAFGSSSTDGTATSLEETSTANPPAVAAATRTVVPVAAWTKRCPTVRAVGVLSSSGGHGPVGFFFGQELLWGENS